MRAASPIHAVRDTGDSRVPTPLCATCGAQRKKPVASQQVSGSAGQQVSRSAGQQVSRPVGQQVAAALCECVHMWLLPCRLISWRISKTQHAVAVHFQGAVRYRCSAASSPA